MLNINTNIPSLIAQRSLNNSTKLLNQAIVRMTTGFKINHASDNAANYSISTNMSTKISSYQVAEDNVASGLDLLSTADGSLDLISDKLTRLRALAEQASNGTYGDQSLKAINSEANAIVDEIETIYSTAEYNGIKLFGTSGGSFIKEVQRRDTSSMTKLSSIDPTQSLTSGTYSISTAEELEQLATMTNNGKIDADTEFVLANNIDLSAYSSGEGWTPIGNNLFLRQFKATFDGNGYVVSNLYINKSAGVGYGLFGTIAGAEINNLGVENINITGKVLTGGLVGCILGGNNNISNCYVTGNVKLTNPNNKTHGVIGVTGSSEITDCYYNNNKISRQSGNDIPVITSKLNESQLKTISSSQERIFQIGIDSQSCSQIALDTAFGLNVAPLRGIGKGIDLLNRIDMLINQVGAKQTEYGAVQNRLESALEEISTQYDNLVSSRSTLRDADIAEVSSDYIRQQILQQASAILMATANQSPALALQLL